MTRCIARTLAALAAALLVAVAPAPAAPPAPEELSSFDRQVLNWAEECRDAIAGEMRKLVATGKLRPSQLFDTFYIPIPDTDPQKFHTQYDRFFDETIQVIEDRYLKKDKRVKFVVAVDKNGYLPTHNAIYSQPLSGNNQIDVKANRTKRMFNDRTGLAAARSIADYLIQRYSRDTGETMYDLSVPIFYDEQHWGALRIGYTQ